jgi:hypothetical protein
MFLPAAVERLPEEAMLSVMCGSGRGNSGTCIAATVRLSLREWMACQPWELQ